ncbi:hypothetical protein BDB00DRAFT_770798, partial [Zychaea mexicana]|uniref:uncharacterized protein n=1 Tax=Zychaea mexicana TaxID=64656 RepID=UPI0022FEE358
HVINTIARSLTDTPDDTYLAGQSDSIDSTRCNVLYVLRLADSTESRTLPPPPIAINVRSSVDEAYMSQIIQQCACIFEKHQKAPISLVFFCVDKVGCNVLERSSLPQGFPFLKEVRCNFWAERRFLLSKDDFISGRAYHPLLDIARFISSHNDCILLTKDQ